MMAASESFRRRPTSVEDCAEGLALTRGSLVETGLPRKPERRCADHSYAPSRQIDSRDGYRPVVRIARPPGSPGISVPAGAADSSSGQGYAAAPRPMGHTGLLVLAQRAM